MKLDTIDPKLHPVTITLSVGEAIALREFLQYVEISDYEDVDIDNSDILDEMFEKMFEFLDERGYHGK